MAKTHNAGRISIDMVADTVQYVEALRKAEKEGNKRFGNMSRDAEKSSKGITNAFKAIKGSAGIATGAFALVSAGVLSLANDANASQQQLEKFAAAGKTTADELRLLGNATNTVGINQEKFADIIKDVVDRIGDFASTGAGPLVDLFDVLGDKTTLTIDKLQQMSGPNALGAITAEMQRLNVPMEKQTFIMESLAGDASALIPLYANNAKQLTELYNRQKDLTALMDGETRQTWQDAATAADLLYDNIGILVSQALEPMADAFEDAATAINGWLTEMNKTNIAEKKDEYKDLNAQISEQETLLAQVTAQINNVSSAYGASRSIVDPALLSQQKALEENINLLRQQRDLVVDNSSQFAHLDGLVKFGTMDSFVNPSNPKGKSSGSKSGSSSSKSGGTSAKAADPLDQLLQFAVMGDQVQQQVRDSTAMHYETMAEMEANFQQMLLEQKMELASSEMARVQLQADEELRIAEEKYRKMGASEQQFQAMRQALAKQTTMNMATAAQQDAENLGGALASVFGVEKEFALGMMIIKQGMAIANAFASNEPMTGMAMASMIVGTFASITSAVEGASFGGGGGVMGQFHSGTDYVPSEGSFLLQKGERVIAPRANKKLESFLDSNGKGGGVNINANMTVQGNVTDQKWFSEQLVKQRNTIAAAYQKVQKERPRRR